ncbi:DNA replication complex GINS protein SLD5 [Anthonomus grandis grandis]|uniref:DNA replication complex GINS protein SLD5 n=1 Tax=Anthonomus grandis grandis TaxID=2921223 RepID=UPI0021651B07|nr:DNA replication complex GINS protein SLD5 [Anthonomus grandis grandis]
MDVDENIISEDMFDEDEEGDISLEQVIKDMEEAWLNEKFAPEILPHKMEYVEILLGQITNIETQLQQLKNTDFKKGIHQMEVDRLRFIVTSYLRLRLEKIEAFSTHILNQEKQRAENNRELYLSPNELEFAQEFEQNLKQHLDSFLSFCPDAVDVDAQLVAPNIHSMVFLKSKKAVEGIVIDDGDGDNNDLIDLPTGSQILISYNSVSDLVKKGDVHLI